MGLKYDTIHYLKKESASINQTYNGIEITLTSVLLILLLCLNQTYNGIEILTDAQQVIVSSLNQTYNGIEILESNANDVWRACLNQTYNGIEIHITSIRSIARTV